MMSPAKARAYEKYVMWWLTYTATDVGWFNPSVEEQDAAIEGIATGSTWDNKPYKRYDYYEEDAPRAYDRDVPRRTEHSRPPKRVPLLTAADILVRGITPLKRIKRNARN